MADNQAPSAARSGRSKRTKVIILLAVVVVLAGAVFGFRSYQNTTREYNRMAEALLDRTFVFSDSQRKDMLSGTGIYGPAFMQAKDKPRFRKILVQQFRLMVEDEKIAGSSMDFQRGINEAITELEHQGIHEEEIRTAYQTCMNARLEDLMKGFTTITLDTISLKSYFDDLSLAQSEFYTEGVVDDGAVADYIKGKIDEGLAGKDFRTVAQTLSLMADAGYTDACYPDTGVLLDQLLENCEVYSVSDQEGGYYRDQEDSSSYSSSGYDPAGIGSSIGTTTSSGYTNYFGDFSLGHSESSTTLENLPSFELEQEYNTSSHHTSFYFRDMSMANSADSQLIGSMQWASKNGALYAFCGRTENPDSDKARLDCVALLNRNTLFLPYAGSTAGSRLGSCYTVEGDFADALKEVRQRYRSTDSLEG